MFPEFQLDPSRVGSTGVVAELASGPLQTVDDYGVILSAVNRTLARASPTSCRILASTSGHPGCVGRWHAGNMYVARLTTTGTRALVMYPNMDSYAGIISNRTLWLALVSQLRSDGVCI